MLALLCDIPSYSPQMPSASYESTGRTLRCWNVGEAWSKEGARFSKGEIARAIKTSLKANPSQQLLGRSVGGWVDSRCIVSAEREREVKIERKRPEVVWKPSQFIDRSVYPITLGRARRQEAIFPLWPWGHKSAHRLTADFSSSRSFPVSLDRPIVLARTAASGDNWALCYQGRKQLVWPLLFRCFLRSTSAWLLRSRVRACECACRVWRVCFVRPRELTWIAPRRRARIDCEASGKRSTLGAERCSWSAGLHAESFSQRFFRAIFEGRGRR